MAAGDRPRGVGDVLLPARRGNRSPCRGRRWGSASTCGALDMSANALYVVAVQQGALGIVATLVSLYPASTVLLARVVLGERLSGLQLAGVACALLAVVLLVGGSG